MKNISPSEPQFPGFDDRDAVEFALKKIEEYEYYSGTSLSISRAPIGWRKPNKDWCLERRDFYGPDRPDYSVEMWLSLDQVKALRENEVTSRHIHFDWKIDMDDEKFIKLYEETKRLGHERDIY